MICCSLLEDGIDRGAFYFGERQRVDDGRFVNDLDTDYFVRSATSHGYDYIGINYCPFCGRALSRGLWVAEKKK